MIQTKLKHFVTQNFKLLALGLLGLGLVIYVIYDKTQQSQRNPQAQLAQLMSASQEKTAPSQSSTKHETVIVDVKGAVHQPGVYEVEADLRVTDVIEIAGGLRPDADQNQVNLAQKITDEQVIYVPIIGETPPTNQASQTSEAGSSGGKVNINSATLEELQTLSGIGAKKAQDIIDYREAQGPFSTVEDLGEVSGFGEKTIEKLRDAITVD
jgi:competence protein ComEA